MTATKYLFKLMKLNYPCSRKMRRVEFVGGAATRHCCEKVTSSYFEYVFSNTDYPSRLVFYMHFYQPIETEFFTNRSIFAKEKDWALVFVFKFNDQLRDLRM